MAPPAVEVSYGYNLCRHMLGGREHAIKQFRLVDDGLVLCCGVSVRPFAVALVCLLANWCCCAVLRLVLLLYTSAGGSTSTLDRLLPDFTCLQPRLATITYSKTLCR